MSDGQDIAIIIAAARRHGWQVGDTARRRTAGAAPVMSRDLAVRRLRALGSVEAVIRWLEIEHADARTAEFKRRWREFEDRFYRVDAAARHAGVLVERPGVSQGQRVAMLLVAAEHAGMATRELNRHSCRLADAVSAELGRRFPGEDGRVHRDMVKRAYLSTGRRIDELQSKALRRDVGRVVEDLERALKRRVRDGWTPDPERFRIEVVEAANHAASRV